MDPVTTFVSRFVTMPIEPRVLTPGLYCVKVIKLVYSW